LPTHQIVGLGVAAGIALAEGAADAAHARDLAARLWRELEPISDIEFNGHREHRIPGLINLSFAGVEGESLITGLPGIAVSSGAACSSAAREPSYVLRSLGRSTELAQSSLRLSLGRFTTAADVDEAATAIRAEVSRLRLLAGGSGVAVPPPDDAFGDSLMARTLSPLARQYFRAPARVPQFPDGTRPSDVRQGRAGRLSEGSQVFFELKIADGIVKSARFSAYGCPHTVAVAAWLCEVLEGSRLDAGPPGTPVDWAEKFEVPAEKLGRLLIVEDALLALFN
jgi:cysteine desulfurase